MLSRNDETLNIQFLYPNKDTCSPPDEMYVCECKRVALADGTHSSGGVWKAHDIQWKLTNIGNIDLRLRID